MRKHKSVVAILLAVMMIFTFMPTMAFASTTGSDKSVWNDTFTEVTKEGTTYTASHQAINQNSGMQVASCDYAPASVQDIYYYDLKGATINVAKNISLAEYQQLLENGTVTVTVHTKDSNGNDVTGNVHTNAWTAKVTGEKIEKLKGNKKVTLTVEFTAAHAGTTMDGSSMQTPLLVNTPLTQDVNVIGSADTPVNGDYYVDGDTTKNPARSVPYDGEEHTFQLAAADNYTVSYEKYNASTGKWEATDAISVKEVKTQYDLFRGVYKDSKGDVFGTPVEFRPVVTKAEAPALNWKKGNGNRQFNYEVTAAQAETPWIFVELTTAAKSDVSALVAYLQARYEFEIEKSVADENIQTWRVVDSKAYKANPADFEKQYDELFNNYELDNGDRIENNLYSVDVHVVTDPVVEVADDISFSGVTTKSFKAKKKTKKLAKTKTFQVAAAADSGKVITFTGTSSNAKVSIDATGKVTVKKGLKKGTKVKLVVKAKTAAGNGYKAASAEKTYTIKIK